MAPQVTTSMPCHSVVFCPWVIWALLAEILLIVIAAQPLQSIKPTHLVCCSLNFGNQFDLCLKNVSNLWTWFDIWHIWMYMNIYKPIWTYLNLSEHTWTYLNVSECIWTYHNIPECIRMYLNIYEPIWTYQHLSKPIKTYRVYPNLYKVGRGGAIGRTLGSESDDRSSLVWHRFESGRSCLCIWLCKIEKELWLSSTTPAS